MDGGRWTMDDVGEGYACSVRALRCRVSARRGARALEGSARLRLQRGAGAPSTFVTLSLIMGPATPVLS